MAPRVPAGIAINYDLAVDGGPFGATIPVAATASSSLTGDVDGVQVWSHGPPGR